MTAQEAIDYFQILQDKYGSPSVTTAEALDYLNHAINEYLNRIFPDNQGAVVNFEQDKLVTANIQPLIYDVSTSTDSAGLLTNTALNTALVALAGAGAEYFRIGAIGATVDEVTYPVRYIRANNLWTYTRNAFKTPTETNPRFELVAAGLQTYPQQVQDLVISLVKKPKVLTQATITDQIEFADYTLYPIIAIALQLAGVATRDEELIQDIRNITVQGK